MEVKQITQEFKKNQVKNGSSISQKESKEKIENKDDKTEKEIKRNKKSEAIVNGFNLGISTKHSVAVCNFIRNKNIDNAISELENVLKFKFAIPMKGEIPHKKGMKFASGSGRYPINAIREFLKLLNSLKANAIYNEMELEKFKIFCMANQASRQHKRFGQRKFKRTHVKIKLIKRNER